MKLLPALVALSLLVGCSDPNWPKIAKEETHYDDGSLKSESYHLVDSGLHVGLVTYWHPNGQKAAEGEHHGVNIRHDIWSTWHENGQMASRGVYWMGEEKGLWTYWNEDGSTDTDTSGTYEDGKRVADADGKKVAPLPDK